MDDLTRLVAKDAIGDLVLRYSTAIADRDVDAMVALYSDDASFGAAGTGPEALRSLMAATMGDLQFGVILVANHLIEVESPDRATGEVWCRCYAQNAREGYYEQLIKYVDRYVRVATPTLGEPGWRFEHRRHLLWFGQQQPSPLGQAPAEWPKANVGVGRIPLADPVIEAWRAGQAR